MAPKPTTRKKLRPRGVFGVERLEDRRVLSVTLTDHEQLLLELVNRARANPAAEAARFGIDLNEGLAAGTITADYKAPLAPHQALIQSAENYAQWLLDHNYFDHVTPAGQTPSDRARIAGYPGGAGENIAYKAKNEDYTPEEKLALVYDEHEQLFRSHGHRENMMTPYYREAGTGVRFGDYTPPDNLNPLYAIMVAEEFSLRGGDYFLTGVAYSDRVNRNDFYDVGEGLSSVLLTAVAVGDLSATSYTTTTGPSGGYTLQLPNGVYQVTASGGALATPIVFANVVVNGHNTKLDINPIHSTVTVVSGIAFNDFNQNGLRESNETALSPVTVFVDTNNDSIWESSEPSITTPSNGQFLFSGLGLGKHRIMVSMQPNWRETRGNAGGHNIELSTSATTVGGLVFSILIPNAPPIPLPDAFQIAQNTTGNLDVLANDVDPDNNLAPTTWELVVAPQRGIVTFDTISKRASYVPQPTFVGTDTFDYRLRDLRGAVSNAVKVTITVGNSAMSPYQNADNVFDVNAVGGVTPLDALAVLEEINQAGARQLPLVPPPSTPGSWWDVNGDGYVSAIDALLVLNAILRSIRMRDAILSQHVAAAIPPISAAIPPSVATDLYLANDVASAVTPEFSLFPSRSANPSRPTKRFGTITPAIELDFAVGD